MRRKEESEHSQELDAFLAGELPQTGIGRLGSAFTRRELETMERENSWFRGFLRCRIRERGLRTWLRKRERRKGWWNIGSGRNSNIRH